MIVLRAHSLALPAQLILIPASPAFPVTTYLVVGATDVATDARNVKVLHNARFALVLIIWRVDYAN